MLYTFQSDIAVHVYRQRPSCVGEQTILRTEQGLLTASEILRRFVAGRMVSFRTTRPDGSVRSTPVAWALPTRAPGRELSVGGERVALTDGHMVLLGRKYDDEGEVLDLSRTSDIRVGDAGIASVRTIDSLPAVRIWLAEPATIKTAGGLELGTRHHELAQSFVLLSAALHDDDAEVVATTTTRIRGEQLRASTEYDHEQWREYWGSIRWIEHCRSYRSGWSQTLSSVAHMMRGDSIGRNDDPWIRGVPREANILATSEPAILRAPLWPDGLIPMIRPTLDLADARCTAA